MSDWPPGVNEDENEKSTNSGNFSFFVFLVTKATTILEYICQNFLPNISFMERFMKTCNETVDFVKLPSSEFI